MGYSPDCFRQRSLLARGDASRASEDYPHRWNLTTVASLLTQANTPVATRGASFEKSL